MYNLLLLLSIILLIGCEQRVGLAPVVELKWQPQSGRQNTHTIRKGETLYAVAFRYDQDYRHLALFNHLKSPYTLHVGQVLQLPNSKTMIEKETKTGTQARRYPVSKRQAPDSSLSKIGPPPSNSRKWIWPVKGHIASGFIPQQGKKGIDIAGKKGEKICAASDGVVAYAGSGLVGYGNLIIIKHDNQLLTAYGNNLRNRVAEGQKVKAGQVIAEMGVVDRRFWGVHFEIRKAGRPVNPLNYLQKVDS